MLKYFSTFSGIGGFELGIQQAYEELLNEMELRGCGQKKSKLEATLPLSISQSNQRQHPTCLGYSEIDKYAIQVYQQHFNHKNYGDITKIKTEELPDFDLICGGFPCQSFSIAGKRGGFNDTRGTLFFEVARILGSKQPRLVLLENVKGLLSHDGGRTFATIIATLDELGYDVQWQVLNSKNFGVPQNRERVFIVGNLRGTPRPEVFPIGESDGVPAEKFGGETQATHPIRAGYKPGQGGNDFIIHNIYGGFGEKEVREFHDVSPTIRTPQGGGHIPMVVKAPNGKKVELENRDRPYQLLEVRTEQGKKQGAK